VVEVALLFCRVCLKGKKPKEKAYPKEITTIGDAIRKRRLDLGLLQKDVAKVIGCDKTTILNWEKGHTRPSAKHTPQMMVFSDAQSSSKVLRKFYPCGFKESESPTLRRPVEGLS
jgi:DNA-binding XRE family transcriptional regulator